MQGLFHHLLAITSCCTDNVQLTLQNLGGNLEILCRRLATCILQQCRRRPATVTRWRTTPTGGYDRPTQRSPYSTPFSVTGGHREQRRQRTQRDARNKDTEGREQRRRRQPLQQVVSSVCSLSASSTSATQPCCTYTSCMPSTTSDSGRKATHALVIHKGKCPGMQKKPGETSGRGKRPEGSVRRECPFSLLTGSTWTPQITASIGYFCNFLFLFIMSMILLKAVLNPSFQKLIAVVYLLFSGSNFHNHTAYNIVTVRLKVGYMRNRHFTLSVPSYVRNDNGL